MSVIQAGYIRWVVEPIWVIEPIFVMKKFCGSLSVANSLQAYSFVPYFRLGGGGGVSNYKFWDIPQFVIIALICNTCPSL